jgi:pyruvate dehydrogenase E2 component (dihydrolipoamide acetyltransferase)
MLGVVKRMTVTVTCDHRHIYGADAALFLDHLAKVLEGDINVLLK